MSQFNLPTRRTARAYLGYTAAIVLLAVGIGCTASGRPDNKSIGLPPSPAASTSPAVPATLSDGRVPLFLTVSGPSLVRPNEQIEITIAIERTIAVDAELRVAIPAGATLLSGTLVSQIVASEGLSPKRILKLQLGAIPTTDVLVEATAGGSGWGVHARKAYRFGRPEPMLKGGGEYEADP